MKRRNKNIEVDVPNDKTTEVVRQKGLRKGTYSQARIAVLIFTLVLALGIGATFAYVVYTGNQTQNRATAGDVGLQIVENGTVNTTGALTVAAGTDTKKVAVKSEDLPNRADEIVRVTFVPEVIYKDSAGSALGNTLLSETWSAPQQTGEESNKFYIKTDLLTLYLADDWQDNYIYKDGAFIYKKILGPGETTPTLLQGVVWADASVNRGDYGDIKVNVVADALQCTPAESPALWGVKVDTSSKEVSLITATNAATEETT